MIRSLTNDHKWARKAVNAGWCWHWHELFINCIFFSSIWGESLLHLFMKLFSVRADLKFFKKWIFIVIIKEHTIWGGACGFSIIVPFLLTKDLAGISFLYEFLIKPRVSMYEPLFFSHLLLALLVMEFFLNYIRDLHISILITHSKTFLVVTLHWQLVCLFFLFYYHINIPLISVDIFVILFFSSYCIKKALSADICILM